MFQAFYLSWLVYNQDINRLFNYSKENLYELLIYLLDSEKYDLLYELVKLGVKDYHDLIIRTLFKKEKKEELIKFYKLLNPKNGILFLQIFEKYPEILTYINNDNYDFFILYHVLPNKLYDIYYENCKNRNMTNIIETLIKQKRYDDLKIIFNSKNINILYDYEKIIKNILLLDIEYLILFFKRDKFLQRYFFKTIKEKLGPYPYKINNQYKYEEKEKIFNHIKYFIENKLLDKNIPDFIFDALKNKYPFEIIKLLFEYGCEYKKYPIQYIIEIDKFTKYNINEILFYLDKGYIINNNTITDFLIKTDGDLKLFYFFMKKNPNYICLPFHETNQIVIINSNIKIPDLINIIDMGILDLNLLKKENSKLYIKYLEYNLYSVK